MYLINLFFHEEFSLKKRKVSREKVSQQQEGFPVQSEGFQGGFSELIDEMEENSVYVDESISEYNSDMGENEGESIELVQ